MEKFNFFNIRSIEVWIQYPNIEVWMREKRESKRGRVCKVSSWLRGQIWVKT